MLSRSRCVSSGVRSAVASPASPRMIDVVAVAHHRMPRQRVAAPPVLHSLRREAEVRAPRALCQQAIEIVLEFVVRRLCCQSELEQFRRSIYLTQICEILRHDTELGGMPEESLDVKCASALRRMMRFIAD